MSCRQCWTSGNPFSPNSRSFPLFVELRTGQAGLANDVVELAIGHIRPVGVRQFDLLAIVDPVEAVSASMIWNSCEVTLNKVVVDFPNGRNIRYQNTLATLDPIYPVNWAIVKMEK